MPGHHLAEVNIAHMIAPLDDPLMADFVAQLDYINAVADRSPGFVWRLQTPEGDSTGVRAYRDPKVLFNLSVWEDIESLYAYTYASDHLAPFRDRRRWFEKMDGPHLALWWVADGHVPSIEEAKRALETLAERGPTPEAFTFKKAFDAEGRPWSRKGKADWAFGGA